MRHTHTRTHKHLKTPVYIQTQVNICTQEDLHNRNTYKQVLTQVDKQTREDTSRPT